MSVIDTIQNAHVGSFFNIPIYWFLEETELKKLTHQASNGERVNKLFMSIGGGSGEHSALIINNEAVVLKFLSKIKDELNPKEFNEIDQKIFELTEQIQDDYLTNCVEMYGYELDQNQWPLETFIEINQKINKLYDSDESLQDKIKNALALFIIYEMPLKHCLKDPQLIEVASLIRTNKWKSIFEDKDILKRYVGFESVTHKSGMIIKDNKTIWGYSMEDWKKDNNSFELSEKLNSELSTKSNQTKVKI